MRWRSPVNGSLGSDSCPAACQKDSEETTVDENGKTVVKAGDLSISATAASNRKAVIGGVYDLDTITLKASEAITLNSVTLERYGYSTADDIESVWLENADGTQISNPKSLSTKDTVNLTVKKDYKELEAEDVVTIVVKLKSTAKAGGTIGFKVTDVDSSAKNVNLSNYEPYTYDVVEYTGVSVTLTQKGKGQSYNYENGNSYEVQRFKVKAETSSITVNGFTLKQSSAASMKLKDNVESLEVTVDGDILKNVTWDINSKDEVKINFDSIDIETRSSATFAVNFIFVKDLEDLGKTIQLTMATADFNAIEKKTGARVTVENTLAGYLYTINGGKINLTNTKLGTVEASAETDDVVFGKGKITLGWQTIVLNPFEIVFTTKNNYTSSVTDVATAGDAKYPAIKNVRVVIGDEEFSSSCSSTLKSGDPTTWGNGSADVTYTTTCTFKSSMTIDEDSDIEFLADLTKYAASNSTISIADSFGKIALTKVLHDTSVRDSLAANPWKYDDANSPIDGSNFIGTISYSSIKVQSPKGTLENKISKSVEFVAWESSTRTIFEGTYTAKSNDVYLNAFAGSATITSSTDYSDVFDDMTLHLYVDGKEVASPSASSSFDGTNKTSFAGSEDFANTLVEKWKSVAIKVELEAHVANGKTSPSVTMDITLGWEDKDGNPAWTASETAVSFKAATAGSVTVSDSAYATKTIELKETNITLAKFALKPSKWSSEVDLDSLKFNVALDGVAETDKTKYRVKVGGTEISIDDYSSSVFNVASDLNETIGEEWIIAEIIAKNPEAGNYVTTLVNVNNSATDLNRTYTRLVMPVKVTFTQLNQKWSTKIIASMDNGDNEVEINQIDLYVNGANKWTISNISEWNDGDVEIAGEDGTKMIDRILISTNESAGTPAVVTATLASAVAANINTEIDINGKTWIVTATNGESTATFTQENAALYSFNSADFVGLSVGWKSVSAASQTTAGTSWKEYSIEKSAYNDYFKVGESYLKIFDKDA